MMCSFLQTQLLDVKQYDVYLASDLVVRRKERCDFH
jgi:hypothetical protein